MLANPTPAQAFPRMTQALATYQAQYPVWATWRLVASQLWAAAPTLDAPGLRLVTTILERGAWVLDTLLAQMPAQVSLWLWAYPAVSAAWRMWGDIATQAVAAQPTQTLALTPAAHGALTVLQQWDPLTGANAPAAPDAVLLQVLQGVQIVPTQAPTNPAAGSLIPVLVTQFTDLMQLAAQYLGTPEAWPQIAAANQLRPPYLSDRLWDQYGPPLQVWAVANPSGTWTTVAAIQAGQTTLALSSVAPFTVTPGMVLVAEQPTATGRQQEAWTITAWDGTTATFSPAAQNAYTAGALVGLMLNPSQQPGTVLAPGQRLYVPLPQAPPPGLAQGDPFGTDLALTAQGDLAFTPTGDLQTVSGYPNVLQALRNRLESALGSLPLHPTYGSRLADALGMPVGQATALKAFAVEALLADPRVAGVPTCTVQVQGTTVQVQATVQLVGQPEPLAVTAQAPLGG